MNTIDVRKNYLYVYYDEAYDVNRFINMLEEIADTCKKKDIKKVLANLKNMLGEPTFTDRFKLGVASAKILKGGFKFAIVYKNTASNRFSETVAVNRGLPARITDNEEEAKRWLGVE